MHDRQSSSTVELFISSTKMASTASTNVNGKLKKDVFLKYVIKETFTIVELLPGLESFLRSMLNSTHLDTDHRQIATMYIDKLDQLDKPFDRRQQTPVIDDQSL
jgi:hypothetical protein